ncbi:cupin domain-containing protein [Halobacillus sp. Marseille-Q1614]|uniref:cupin domain-containing protein n=1 Tax=Halobacillus sp. Marseille-Q1614 TaxID=2709134 RepID=UPI0015710728|nr:cupin domain-containing protein [Halobacillus sp. Marseille-Q1614]
MKSDDLINQLGLKAHPEGGFYKPTYESDISTETPHGKRSLYTSIYFLLRSKDVSHFHRLQSDELWYFHGGSPLTVHMITPEGEYKEVKLGLNISRGEVPQFVVSKHTIFGSSVDEEDTFSLAGCMVSPGFDFEDFELFEKQELMKQYPQHRKIINKLAYEK